MKNNIEMICPTCGKKFITSIKDRFFPFDSKICQLADLYDWIFEQNIIFSKIEESQENDNGFDT